MLGMLLALAANALAVIVTAAILPGEIAYENWTAVGVFAVIVGVLNAFLRPIVRVLTAPIGCITLGLFSIVINGAMFWLAARANVGVTATFLGGVVASLIAGVASGLLNFLARDDA